MRSSKGRPFYWRIVPGTLLPFIFFSYLFAPDILYAIVIWPPFVWTGLGLLLCLPGIRRHRTQWLWVTVVGWIGFWLLFGEDFQRLFTAFSKPKGNIHIVSLNCSGGDVRATAEAFLTKPDIVLLQESPSQKEIVKAAQSLGKPVQVLAGPDASIVTVGKLEPIELPSHTSNFVTAIVRLPNHSPIFVVSLRLQPPVFRLDYWNPDCWRTYAENRASRRQELREIVDWIERQHKGSQIIVGGDFNSQPDTALFKVFQGGMRDATPGSGYTATNEFPMARIDQIWVRGLKPQGSRAEKTENSDHRKVLLWVNGQQAP